MRKAAFFLWMGLIPMAASAAPRGATRIEFDGELVKGQTNQGAVHVIKRKDSNLGSLVRKRVHFRERILGAYVAEKPIAGMQFELPDGRTVPAKRVAAKYEPPSDTDRAANITLEKLSLTDVSKSMKKVKKAKVTKSKTKKAKPSKTKKAAGGK